MANWVLGLTGGIGSGKSAVSAMFEELGIQVVDADIVAREVVEPGSLGLKKITEHFGDEILTSNGTLDRAKLRAIIFADESQKQWLNNLLHPLIRESMLSQLKQATSNYVILVAPLLFENGLEKYCNHTLLIDVPVDVQITRTTARDNVSVELAKQIIASQMSRADKQQKAGDILDNNRPLEEVKTDVQKLHEKYLIHSH
ncbi:dephospho-CoA kinase [Pseudoalteromonas shioyasakiensis]|uniref:Dephospho-CoA kinase n=1 Tax=Pseudoalteromonas shioyasakiensis TaxID=1190813 RepID=A0ABT6U227_9GAMM|nr:MULTISPECIES: dephospho-CoA kinase [Pseudoalteromonas]MDI4670230.1 dephospho-CoA kinase [Pseudoalteromonas shioyasakiensis]MDI4674841.1 dephospho-CoA kinase [Pseudoalteromonas shioyasakiensis]MDI4687122.1 dephospho-CoA kinase [Pseudoalteromonas shioyasakiensis]MDI4705717.1 dephospho-CoA kinase [Pseudoalteromonas shioyasakiensis]NUJ22070.1 dephospho-CoA kinase [Pseudoalteromonas sp. 0802]